jgi:hypothetical protein
VSAQSEQDFLVLSILLTQVDDRIGLFRTVEDMERSFISADAVEESLFRLEDRRLITASMVSAIDQPLPESDMIELTPRGVGYCLANEAPILTAALGGDAQHIDDVRRAFDHIRVESGLSIDSSTWTGLTARLGPQKIAQIRAGVRTLIDVVRQSDLPSVEMENALACANAISLLVEAPDPLWKQIVELLTSKPLTAFLNVGALLTMILGIAH